jgi:GNAT superfamily N-acetyltransferase
MILKASLKHLKQVATLHHQVLDDTINSQIGKDHLLQLYKGISAYKGSTTWVFLKKEQVIGFASMASSYREFNQSLSHLLGWKSYLRVATRLLTYWSDIVEIIDRIRFSNYLEKRYPKRSPWILSIGVSPSYQRKGIGQKLLKTIIIYCKQKKLNAIYVDTKTINKKAIGFYEKNGFEQIDQYLGNSILQKKIA